MPQVTIGLSAAASTTISRSNAAPSSVRSVRHASGTSAGAASRPITHSKVVSSGAIIPARPPPSIVMLQTVIRPSMFSASIAGPAYSTTWPTAPATPIWPIVARIRSLAVTPYPSSPVYEIRIDFGFDCTRHWVASTCSTSLVPIPNASAPNAPWVAVCESPQTIVMPGWVTPSSGPITWTIPWCSEPSEYTGIPNSAQLRSSVSTWTRERASLIRAATGVPSVGTL